MKRPLMSIIIFLVMPLMLFAQLPGIGTAVQTESNPTLNGISKSFDDSWAAYGVRNGFYFENNKRKKAPGWKIFKRWEYYWQQRVNAATGEFPQLAAAAEYGRWRNKLKKGSSVTADWVNLGTNSTAGGYEGIGRINCIAFHPSDTNTFWAGSPSGGIWRTADGGKSWSILNDKLPVLGVSDIAVTNNYSSSKTMYIATGDRDGGSMWDLNGGQVADNASIGVLKSTDGGTTWITTGLTFTANNRKLVYRLLIHPSDNNILFASLRDPVPANAGIYKSTDGGATWVKKISGKYFIDMEFKPGDPSVIYASTRSVIDANQYIYRSTDGGESWNNVYSLGVLYRAELAVSPADPNAVYCLSTNPVGGLRGIFKSTDAGAAFSQVNTNRMQNMLGYYSDGSGDSTGQGSYDLCIAVNPADANIVYIGGVNSWMSTDGGAVWNPSNCWTEEREYNITGVPAVHADKHALVFQNGWTLFEGNDGGVYKTTDGGAKWTDLSNGMIISQIYRIGVSQTDSKKVLAGLQDNGTKLYRGAPGSWQDVFGGDGMECIVDPANASSYMYVTYVEGNIYRNANGFSNLETASISENLPGGQQEGAWVTPYIMDPNNSASLFAGYDSVYKTTDRGDSWKSVSQSLSPVDKLRSLAIAPSDSKVLYAAERNHLWKTTDGGATAWTEVKLPNDSSYVTYIAVKKTDPKTLWLTFGGFISGKKIFQSTDGGGTWTNISAGLPNLPVMCIVQYAPVNDRSVLFAGTDVGVYVKNGSGDWEEFSGGLPNVVVTELEFFYGATRSGDRLRAATYGRGLWETSIPSVLPVENSANAGAPLSFSVEQNYPNPFNPSTTINFSLPDDGNVSVILYDALGRHVRTILNEFKPSGCYSVLFHADDLASGLYAYRVSSGKYAAVRKMLLVR